MIVNMELAGRRNRGRPQKRLMDVVKDMHRVDVTGRSWSAVVTTKGSS